MRGVRLEIWVRTIRLGVSFGVNRQFRPDLSLLTRVFLLWNEFRNRGRGAEEIGGFPIDFGSKPRKTAIPVCIFAHLESIC
ncbi:MAG: hypothetical protein RLZZ458_2643 [Planctomycetota bacterium]